MKDTEIMSINWEFNFNDRSLYNAILFLDFMDDNVYIFTNYICFYPQKAWASGT